jgi:hypothetical protein
VPYVLVHANHGDPPNGIRALLGPAHARTPRSGGRRRAQSEEWVWFAWIDRWGTWAQVGGNWIAAQQLVDPPVEYLTAQTCLAIRIL